jgi:branched-chain amino acid transport system ATP-binding protein
LAAILETRELSIAFGGLTALDGLDMAAEEGVILGLIGPNGAGKTTVFNLLTGVYKANRGSVLYRGREIGVLPPHEIVELGIARTFQNIRLFRSLSVLENVMVGYAVHLNEPVWKASLLPESTRRERARWVDECEGLLDMVGVLEVEDEPATALPYGKQRLVEIARALATKPRVLLLDEPSAGMNPAEKTELMRFITSIQEKMHLTTVVIEHDMKVLMNLVERVIVLDYGKKIAEGTPSQIKNDPRVIEAYLGTETDDEEAEGDGVA